MARKSKHKKPKPPTVDIQGDADNPVLQVRAATWRHLLQAAAQGLDQVITSKSEARASDQGTFLPIELHRRDFDALLEAWLEELLHLGREHGMSFYNFEILQLDLEADCRLTAMVEGTPLGTERSATVVRLGAPRPRAQQREGQLHCTIPLSVASPDGSSE